MFLLFDFMACLTFYFEILLPFPVLFDGAHHSDILFAVLYISIINVLTNWYWTAALLSTCFIINTSVIIFVIHLTTKKDQLLKIRKVRVTRRNQRRYDNLITLKLCSLWPWPRPRVKQQSQLDRSFALTRSCAIKERSRLLCAIQTDL